MGKCQQLSMHCDCWFCRRLTEDNFLEVWEKHASAATEVITSWIGAQPSKDAAYVTFRMSAKSATSPLAAVDKERRILKNFWEQAISSLPKIAFDGPSTLLQYGESARELMEIIDIANYYRLKLWTGSGHYLDPYPSNNRPSNYPFMERAWNDTHPDQLHASTTANAAAEETNIKAAVAALQVFKNAAVQLHAATQDSAALETVRKAATAAEAAIAACRLPLSEQAVRTAAQLTTSMAAAPAAAQVESLQGAIETAYVQFMKPSCEN